MENICGLVFIALYILGVVITFIFTANYSNVVGFICGLFWPLYLIGIFIKIGISKLRKIVE